MDQPLFLPRDHFDQLIEQLGTAGYRCLGPMVRDGAIVYRPIGTSRELPRGIGDDQAPGRYRLTANASRHWFDWANGPQALKPLTFAPRETLWRARRDDQGRLEFIETIPEVEKQAVIGVRACDLAALALQDRHFKDDPHYRARRAALLLVAVHCNRPAATCFCHATGDGPRATSGFDIALHELDDGFLLETGSRRGESIAATLPLRDSTAPQRRAAAQATAAAIEAQSRKHPLPNLQAPLPARLDHPRWDTIANRCLDCGNCTAVCPSCFCHRQRDEATLDGSSSDHLREWDSCFTRGHSYIHGVVIRATTAQRYRQWLLHKLLFWHDQYGRSGCVGCGRCITWCPAGIDLTEEVHALVAD